MDKMFLEDNNSITGDLPVSEESELKMGQSADLDEQIIDLQAEDNPIDTDKPALEELEVESPECLLVEKRSKKAENG